MSEQTPFIVRFTAEAEDDLARLDRTVKTRILKALRRLAANATSVRHYALKGELSRFYRLRVGDYR